MGNDAIGYFFIILLLLIAAPLLFWVASVLYAWVKWLFNDKKKLNESYNDMGDIKNPVAGKQKITYKLGTDSEVQLVLSNPSFKELNIIFKEKKQMGKHQFHLDTTLIGNGIYFLQLKTAKHTISKKIIIDN